MKEQNGIGLLGTIVTILVILFIFLVFLPSMDGASRSIKEKVLCERNLKSLGTASIVYANDYDDNYPQLPGTGPWSKQLGFDYNLENPDFSEDGAEGAVSRTVTASWYLLVRETDISPKSFVCPASEQKVFIDRSSGNSDIVNFWDFGHNPYQHVSYTYHNPYGKFPPDGSRSAAFAIAADMSPWFNNGDMIPPGKEGMPPQIITLASDPRETDREILKLGNSNRHRYKNNTLNPGQNVLFGDGHTSFEQEPNVGVKHDNIFTYWPTDQNPTDQDRQGGTAPANRSPENDAKSTQDSFLVL